MISSTSVRTVMLGVLNDYVLQNVRHVFAIIDGGFEKLVDFLELDQRDGVLLFVEQIGDGAAPDQIGFILQPVDLDAMVPDWAVLFPRLERIFYTPPPIW